MLIICDAGGSYRPVGATLEARRAPAALRAMTCRRDYDRSALTLLLSSAACCVQGRRSRSLVAIYKILAAGGFENVYHVAGGIREWCVWSCSLHASFGDCCLAETRVLGATWRRCEAR